MSATHLEAVAEGDRLVTHFFECRLPGYRGWRWAVTVTRVPRSRHVTVCETVLLPGPDALLRRRAGCRGTSGSSRATSASAT